MNSGPKSSKYLMKSIEKLRAKQSLKFFCLNRLLHLKDSV